MAPTPVSAQLVGGLTLFLSLLWLILICWPGRWHYEDISLLYIFDVGLYSVNVRKGVAGAGLSLLTSGVGAKMPGKLGVLADALRDAGENLEGQSNLMDVRQIFCAIVIPGFTDELCSMWTRLTYSGWCMAFLGLIGVLCLLIGAFFNHYFWTTCATESGKMLAKMFFWAAPLSLLLGVAQYFAFTMDFHVNLLAGGDEVTFDLVFFSACCLSVLSFLPVLVLTSCTGMDQVPCYKKDKDEAEPVAGKGMPAGGGGYGATANTEAGYGYNAPPPMGMAPPGPMGMPPPMGLTPPAPMVEPQFRSGPSSAALP